MKRDQQTLDGVMWAASFLGTNPEATWVELQANRPPGIKLWKGMMGVVRNYIATGEVFFPESKPRVKAPVNDEPVIPAIQRTIAMLFREIEVLKSRLQKLGV